MRHSWVLILIVMLPLASRGEGLLSGEVPSGATSTLIGPWAPESPRKAGAKGKKKKAPQADPPAGTKRRTDPLTRSEARQLARTLGYAETSNPPFNPHGQPVFKSGNKYITPDKDVHKGGTWKMFDHKGERLGTFNDDLTQKVDT